MKLNEFGLTPNQERFCQEYVVDLNGLKAAVRSGYSEKTAAQQASRLLINVKVTARIQSLADARAERVQVNADTVLTNLLKLATSDLRKLFGVDGNLLPVSQWPDDVALAVSAVEIEELFEGFGEERQHIGYTKKVKLWDKVRSLEALGKHLQLFTEKLQVEHTIKLEDLVTGSMEKEVKK